MEVLRPVCTSEVSIVSALFFDKETGFTKGTVGESAYCTSMTACIEWMIPRPPC